MFCRHLYYPKNLQRVPNLCIYYILFLKKSQILIIYPHHHKGRHLRIHIHKLRFEVLHLRKFF